MVTSKIIVEIHERTTTTLVDADIQLREICFVSDDNKFRFNEKDETKHNIWMQDSVDPIFDDDLTANKFIVGASGEIQNSVDDQALYISGGLGGLGGAIRLTGGSTSEEQDTVSIFLGGNIGMTLSSVYNIESYYNHVIYGEVAPKLTISNTDTTLALSQEIGRLEFYQSDASNTGMGVVASIRAINESSSYGLSGLSLYVGDAVTQNVGLSISSALLVAMPGTLSVTGAGGFGGTLTAVGFNSTGNVNVTITDAVTNTATNVLTLKHLSSGTALSGFGVGILFQNEDLVGSERDTARITATWETDDSNYDGTLNFITRQGTGSLATALTLDSRQRAYFYGDLNLAAGIDLILSSTSDINGSFFDVEGSSGNIVTDGTLTFTKGTRDYQISGVAGDMYFQNTNAGYAGYFDFFTADGDGTDETKILIFGKGSPTQTINLEYMALGYNVTGTRMQVTSSANGTGTVRPLHLYTGTNSTQLVLAIDGSSSFGNSLTVNGPATFVDSATFNDVVTIDVIAGDATFYTIQDENQTYMAVYSSSTPNDSSLSISCEGSIQLISPEAVTIYTGIILRDATDPVFSLLRTGISPITSTVLGEVRYGASTVSGTGASIRGIASGTWAGSDFPTNLEFRLDNAGTMTTYMTLGKTSWTLSSGVAATINSTLGVTGTTSLVGLNLSGNLAVNTNKFNITASNGNTSIAGTLDVTGVTTLSSSLKLGGDVFGTSDTRIIKIIGGNGSDDNSVIRLYGYTSATPNKIEIAQGTTNKVVILQTGEFTFSMPDELNNAYKINDASSYNWLSIDTRAASRKISIGNTTINPAFSFLGTGLTTFGGEMEVAGDVRINTSNILLYANGNATFQGILNVTGQAYFSSIVNLPASTTSNPSLIMAQGTAPTSPSNGMVWMTSAGIYYRAGGVTYGPLT